MVSRKKNKGKERKAKKEENKKAERRSRWERFARGEDENNRKQLYTVIMGVLLRFQTV